MAKKELTAENLKLYTKCPIPFGHVVEREAVSASTAASAYLVTEQHGNRIHVAYHGDDYAKATQIMEAVHRVSRKPGVTKPTRKLWSIMGRKKAE